MRDGVRSAIDRGRARWSKPASLDGWYGLCVRSRMRCARTLLVGAVLLGLVAGQDPPTLSERLRSSYPQTVAWAAYDIARLRIGTQTRNLQAGLQAWGTRNGEQADVVRLHLLDALVQTYAKVPGSVVLPHVRGLTEVPAFVLLARDPRQNEIELRSYFFREPSDGFHTIAWMAAGNLLCAQKAPGFAAWLLQRARFELEIDVVVPGGIVGPRCGGAVLLDNGREAHRRMPGFPPVPAYAFQVGEWDRRPDPDRIDPNLLAAGREPVSFRRTICKTEYLAGESRQNQDPWLVRDWLGALVPGCDTYSRSIEAVEFTTAAAFVDRAQELRRQYAQWQRDLVAALVAGGALAHGEAAAFEVSRAFRLCDCRGDDRRALPDLPAELERPTAVRSRDR